MVYRLSFYCNIQLLDVREEERWSSSLPHRVTQLGLASDSPGGAGFTLPGVAGIAGTHLTCSVYSTSFCDGGKTHDQGDVPETERYATHCATSVSTANETASLSCGPQKDWRMRVRPNLRCTTWRLDAQNALLLRPFYITRRIMETGPSVGRY